MLAEAAYAFSRKAYCETTGFSAIQRGGARTGAACSGGDGGDAYTFPALSNYAG